MGHLANKPLSTFTPDNSIRGDVIGYGVHKTRIEAQFVTYRWPMTVLLMCLGVGRVYAEPAQVEPETLHSNLAIDGTITAVGGVLWLGSELLRPEIAPRACRWCATNGLDDGIRNGLVWTGTGTPDALSYVGNIVLSPLASFGLVGLATLHDKRTDQLLVDALVITESAVLAADLTQLTKYIVARERPFVHQLPENLKSSTAHWSDNNLSFYSGHTTLAFSLATAAGTVASMRHYRLAPIILVSGLSIACATAYLRIAADKHYFTDVVVGAVLGSAFGVGVPWLFHRPRSNALKLAPMTRDGVAGAQVYGMW